MLDFGAIRKKSEKTWAKKVLKNDIYGFQIQPGTMWNKGLDIKYINSVEQEFGLCFPNELKEYFCEMNGLDKKNINVYGKDGRNRTFRHTVFSLDRDRSEINKLYEESKFFDFKKIDGEGCQLLSEPISLFPIMEDVFIVCKPNPSLIISSENEELYVISDSLSTYVLDALK